MEFGHSFAKTEGRTMSAQDVATHLGVAERTVRRWIAGGDLAAEKQGGQFAIRLEDVEALDRIGGRIRRERQQVEDTAARDRAYAELNGRYLELKERVRDLELELAEERKRAARVEAELELRSRAAA